MLKSTHKVIITSTSIGWLSTDIRSPTSKGCVTKRKIKDNDDGAIAEKKTKKTKKIHTQFVLILYSVFLSVFFSFGFSLNAYRYPVFSAHISTYIESPKQIPLLFHHEFAGFCSSTFDPYEALFSIWFLSHMWCSSSHREFLNKGMFLLSQLEISEFMEKRNFKAYTFFFSLM